MKTIFEVLFFKNFSLYVWNIVIGLFASELYVLKKKILPVNKAKNIILATSLFVGIALVLRSTPVNKEEKYSCYAVPYESSCLIENIAESYDEELPDFWTNNVRYLHYFENKTLDIAEFVDSKDDIIYHFSTDCPKLFVLVNDEYEDKIPEDVFKEVASNTNHLKKDGRLFILDKTWKDANKIVCVQSDEQVYFVSEQLLLDMYAGTYEKDYLDEKELALDNIVYMNRCRGERDSNQVALLFAMYLVGWAICGIVFGGEKKILWAFLGLPIAISLINAIGVVYILLGIPLRKVVFLATYLVVVVAIAFMWRKKKIAISVKELAFSILIPIFVISVVVCMKVHCLVGDSLAKTLYAIKMAEYSPTRGEILGYAEVGLLEPLIHCIGWKFHIDCVYGMYILVPICSIGILTSSLYYLTKKKQPAILVTIASIIMLISNDDFMSIGFFVHINGIMACFILILIVMFFFAEKQEVPPVLFVSMLAFGIITARLEGPMYICLFFALLSGLEKFRKKYFYLSLIVGLEILLWETILIIGVKTGTVRQGFDWDIEDALIVVVGAAVVMMLPFILNMNNKFIIWVRKNYYKLAIAAFGIASLVMLFCGPELALRTAKILAKHFATSYESNSGGLWSFVLLMTPLVLQNKKKTTGFLVSTVVCYIFALYILFSLRTGNPIHWSHSDSCRRTLQQIMPTTMFVLSYAIGESDMG